MNKFVMLLTVLSISQSVLAHRPGSAMDPSIETAALFSQGVFAPLDREAQRKDPSLVSAISMRKNKTSNVTTQIYRVNRQLLQEETVVQSCEIMVSVTGSMASLQSDIECSN